MTLRELKRSNMLEALADDLIAFPADATKDRSERLGCSVTFLTHLGSSDAFAAVLSNRRKETTATILHLGMEERLTALNRSALDVIEARLQEPDVSAELALRALELGTRALGLGSKSSNAVGVNFVVQLPEKAATVNAWQETYGQ